MVIDSEPYWHHRRLPHFEAGSIPQGVTFRLADSLPRQMLTEIQSRVALLPEKQGNEEYRRKVNGILDQGLGAQWLKDHRIASIVENALLFFDNDRYTLHAWVVMSNHVHVLFTPAEGWTLTKILHSWKSFTAREANKVLKRSGEFWQAEYFDRAVRDESGFNKAVEYIEHNPVVAGLCGSPGEWRFCSAFHRSAGILPANAQSA